MEVVVTPNPSFWANRRVLLTGHTGFKGSWLALWLLKLGADVWGYAMEPPTGTSLFTELDLENSHLNHHVGNLSNIEDLQGFVQNAQPEVVIHLAAQPLVRESYKDPLLTWLTNVQGSLHLLEALKPISTHCAVVMVTTDKVYHNREWSYGYREDDRLGGHDPYSSSKAAAELAIASWRSSFCGYSPHQTSTLSIATARSGNVIGGGDWAVDRLVPDAVRALTACEPIQVRNPLSTRPWQHVLDPLAGYLLLSEKLFLYGDQYASPFNFGPSLDSNRSVLELVEQVLKYWPGSWLDLSDSTAPHEAGRLHLQTDKAYHLLHWKPRWDFIKTVERTVGWYRSFSNGCKAVDCCMADLDAYNYNQSI